MVGGGLFGEFYARAPKDNLRSADFVMGDPIRRGWISSIETSSSTGRDTRTPSRRGGAPGHQRAQRLRRRTPFLMEALPESRMILLLRP